MVEEKSVRSFSILPRPPKSFQHFQFENEVKMFVRNKFPKNSIKSQGRGGGDLEFEKEGGWGQMPPYAPLISINDDLLNGF